MIDQVVEVLNEGGVICYPTEAVFGLGCDPDNELAVQAVLNIKKRKQEKGLILIADNYAQCLKYVDDESIPMDKRAAIFSSWPGPVTWLLPAKKTTPKWLKGEHDTIAVRITSHPVVKEICRQFNKPLVSTSANLSGQQPVVDINQAITTFEHKVAFYVDKPLGGLSQPSEIKHAVSGKTIRGN